MYLYRSKKVPQNKREKWGPDPLMGKKKIQKNLTGSLFFFKQDLVPNNQKKTDLNSKVGETCLQIAKKCRKPMQRHQKNRKI